MQLVDKNKILAYPLRYEYGVDLEHANVNFACGIESVMEYVESLPSYDEQGNQWRSVRWNPPTEPQEVLVLYYEIDYDYNGENKEFIWTCKGEVEIDRFGNPVWTWEDPYMINEKESDMGATTDYFYCLTHWMPLPAPDIEDIRYEARQIKEVYLRCNGIRI